MDFNHPFFSSEDISIPIPNPGQHPSTPVQMLRRTNNQTYHMLDSGTTHPMMGLSAYTQPPPPSLFAYNQPPPSLSTCTQAPPALSTYTQAPPAISPVEDAEELDTSSRPRLTQEQIATLEDNFKERPKPGTDFKKHLASQIGLSLQRVNVSIESETEIWLTHNRNRIGIRIVAPKPGTRNPRREALMYYPSSLMIPGDLQIVHLRASKMPKIVTKTCCTKIQLAILLGTGMMA